MRKNITVIIEKNGKMLGYGFADDNPAAINKLLLHISEGYKIVCFKNMYLK